VVCAEGKAKVQIKDDFMNGRSGIFKFFLFLFLGVIIFLQFLSMVQADRLYDRLNTLIGRLESHASAPTRPVEKPAASATPAKEYPGDEGDWLIRNLEGEPATLCDFLASSTWPTRWIVVNNIFEPMIDYEPDDFKFRGVLAEKFSISDDGLVIYFKLRDNICFSDGHPITTNDVIFTFKTITDPNIDALQYANYFRDVDHYEKINDKEIKFYMKRVYFLSLGYLGGITIYPEHIYKYKNAREFNERRGAPIGSGPYVFEKWDVGRQLVLRRNENYWGPKPKVKKIVFTFITNTTAELQALLSGQIDYIRPVPDQYAEKSNDENFKKKFYCLSYWDAANTGYFWIGWNEARPFFADKKVRLAMTYLIDREAIKEHILRNPEAQIPTGPFYIYGLQNDPNIKPWPYDPEKAKRLLDEAGWIDHDGDGIRDKNGVPLRFKYMIAADMALHEQIAKLVKDAAAGAGIEVLLDPFEWSVFSQKVKDRDFDAVSMSWGGDLEQDPYQIWHSSQIENRGSNYVGFRNAEADALIEQARQTLDPDKRNALYHRFHRILHEEQPYTFIYTRPEQRFLDKRFQNVIVHKLGINELEWYVPAQSQKYK
jgi:peptide/nickel transport system substrate-binding protein